MFRRTSRGSTSFESLGHIGPFDTSNEAFDALVDDTAESMPYFQIPRETETPAFSWTATEVCRDSNFPDNEDGVFSVPFYAAANCVAPPSTTGLTPVQPVSVQAELQSQDQLVLWNFGLSEDTEKEQDVDVLVDDVDDSGSSQTQAFPEVREVLHDCCFGEVCFPTLNTDIFTYQLLRLF
jgi:hypothetical protein